MPETLSYRYRARVVAAPLDNGFGYSFNPMLFGIFRKIHASTYCSIFCRHGAFDGGYPKNRDREFSLSQEVRLAAFGRNQLSHRTRREEHWKMSCF